jgi:predicted DNA-binding transcriptional regulator AlpA
LITNALADGWLTSRQIRAHFGVSAMSIHRWLHDQRLQFPKPTQIRRRNYWRVADVLEFEQRMVSAGITGRNKMA